MKKEGPTSEEWFNWCSGRSGYHHYDKDGLSITEQEYNQLINPPETTPEGHKEALQFLRTLSDKELDEIEVTLDVSELLIYRVKKERGNV